MEINDQEDVHTLATRLAEECGKAGLNATVLSPTRVHVSSGVHSRLAETVRCRPDDDERLMWWWSWGEPICPAVSIDLAVRFIAHVVAPERVDR
ncbi:hypothetical protein NE236_21430 [Actinoallomurus purpureus]|uniref:hypothetical protein n=1 Tax=Actinoallomurus purpureus TaxID=478114 RepID=UPI0020939D27|nr:hypothetical protein [Actinoallomurus purpureus]MCO6007545.1 hypothetical protein [Actinoallomurus purpureus]